MSETTPPRPERIGLLAGSGRLPVCFARGARDNGLEIVAIALKGECDPALAEHVDHLHWTGLGKLGQWIRLFRQYGVRDAVMCGGVTKTKMYPNVLCHLPDRRTLKLWLASSARGDHDLLGRVAEEFGKEGITIRHSLLYCPQLLAPAGVLTDRAPTPRQWDDIRFAWPLIKAVAALQIGQTLAVKDGAVLAVEGIDGTDATLRRAGALAGPGFVAVKVARKDHDPRFDIPCVGPDTVGILRGCGAAVLAIEACQTLLLEAETTVARANTAGIVIVSLDDATINGRSMPPSASC